MVSKSIVEAEYRSMAFTVCELKQIYDVLHELEISHPLAI